MKSHQILLNFDKIDINKIVFTELKDTEWIDTQKIAYVNYLDENNKSKQFCIKTPEICIEDGGIPNTRFQKEDKDRAYLKFPFCHERKKENIMK